MKYGVLVLLLTTSPCFAEQYICVADMSTGFSYSESTKRWKETSFRTDENKYIISKSDFGKYVLKVTQIGSKYPLAYCEQTFNEQGYLFCSGLGGEFKMQKDNGRYILSYTLGYYNVLPSVNEITDSSSDTPLLEIGKCSPL
ncbi:hypothetical protein [Kangiella taiwanensis]|uniref:Uncharacterized protein n=1 Tax=Kangiella taiwanensis TaxID=1079179 RepID=A0ABP8I3M6_9GAMM|nr:hypothetical protein [Kangiella taiwanensis]